MGNCMGTCLNGATHDERVEPSKGLQSNVEDMVLGSHSYKAVYRDQDPSFFHRFAKDDDSKRESGVIRVKIVMTKEDAARLMSWSGCDGKGGIVNDVINELRKIENDVANRVPGAGKWQPVLETIPESP